MNGFYRITEAFNTILQSEGFRVVTLGDNFKVDLKRQTIFPYCHIVPQSSVVIADNTVTFSFSLFGMDIVDFNKNALRDEHEPFYNTDNMQDVLNDIHNKFLNFIDEFKRGDKFTALLQLEGTVTLDPFMERFENLFAGWELIIDIKVPTDSTIC